MTDELDALWQRLEEQKGSASTTSRLGGSHRLKGSDPNVYPYRASL